MGALLDLVKVSIPPELVQSMAATGGEPRQNIAKGLEIAAATILVTLAGKSTDTAVWGQAVALVGSYRATSAGAEVGATANGVTEASASFLRLLFGTNKAAVESRIAQSAPVSSLIGSQILSAAAPPVLAVLNEKSNGDSAALSAALTAEVPSIRSLVPAGLSGVLSPNLTSVAKPPERLTGSLLWPILLLVALFLGGLVWYFHRGTDGAEPGETATVATKEAVATARAVLSEATKAAWAKLGDLVKRKLPDGTELTVPRLGVENKLVDWIQSSKKVDKSTWFDFDRLLFDSGSTTLEPASREQLSNVASILRAYPQVTIHLGGFTDNVGKPDSNKSLSAERANNVMAELTKLGVSPTRMTAQGYGEEQPIADNKTEFGRQMNRRISLQVTSK